MTSRPAVGINEDVVAAPRGERGGETLARPVPFQLRFETCQDCRDHEATHGPRCEKCFEETMLYLWFPRLRRYAWLRVRSAIRERTREIGGRPRPIYEAVAIEAVR